MNKISTAVSIAIMSLKPYAAGDSIEERFKSVITPAHLSSGCWMTTNDDERFRAAVGAVMLSYGEGTPEFARVEAEMKAIQQFSAWLNAVQLGLQVDVPEIEITERIGLLDLWKSK